MAKVIEAVTPQTAWATMEWRKLLSIFVLGTLAGVVTYALYVLLLQFVFEPIMCRENSALARCESKEDFASVVAIIVGSTIGLILLVRERVYRPLLVIAAVALGLWGIFSLVAGMQWLVGTAVVALGFGLAYAAFAWLAQPVSFLVALICVTVLVAFTRLVLAG